jgi:DNA polymerase III subunit delta
LEYKEIIKSIHQKQLKPVYFLHGEEPFFIDIVTEAIENEILSEAEKSFNLTILYGKDVDSMAVVDNAKRYPMMSQYQVVIIKEAQDMKTLTQLQSYIEHPLSSTVLCIAHKHKKLDMRTAFAKSIAKHAVVMESKPLYDNQVPDFIRNWLKDNKLQIDPRALDMMVEYLGTDLGKIINELEKLQINLPTGGNILPEHIEKFIGISREYNVFELQKALAQRNVLQANKIINYFAENPKNAPFVMIVGNLYNYFSKLYQLYFIQNQSPAEQVKTLGLRSEWFLKDYILALKHFPKAKTEQIISLLREFDLKSKGVDADNLEDSAMMKELVFKILH